MMDAATQMRLTGLASGIDTDAIIQNLGRVHNMRINTVKRDRQYAVWQQESFRNTINMINNFVRSNLNITNPASNFRSPSAFAKFNYNVAMNGLKTDDAKSKAAGIVSITANGDLKNFNQSIQQVAQLASKDTWTGSSVGLREITTKGFDVAKFVRFDENGVITNTTNAMFALSVDGVTRTISVDGMAMRDIIAKTLMKDEYDAGEINGIEWDGNNINSLLVKDGNGDIVTVAEFVRAQPGNDTMTDPDVVNFLRDYSTNNAGEDVSDFFKDKGVTVHAPGDKVYRNEEFVKVLNERIATQFGKDYSGLARINGDGEIVFGKDGSNITISEVTGMGYTLDSMGLTGGETTGAVGTKTLEQLFGSDFFHVKNDYGNIIMNADGTPRTMSREITINGKRIEIKADDTISTMMSRINSSDANVNLSYNSAGDFFELTSKNEGSASNIGEITGAAAQFFEMLNLGKAVEVEREMWSSDGSQSMWVSGYKFAIGGELMSPLQAGERLIINSADGTSSKSVELLGNGDLKVIESSILREPPLTMIDGEVAYGGDIYDLGDKAGYDALLAKLAQEDKDLFDLNGTVRTSTANIVNGQLVITRKTSVPESVITKKADGSYDIGANNYADQNAALAALGLDVNTSGTRSEGKNLIATINGVEFIRQTNTFVHEGMTFTFHDTFNIVDADGDGVADVDPVSGEYIKANSTDSIKIEVGKDTAALIESIKGFVEEYNSILDHLNGLLNEKRDRDYPPLSDDERKALSEDEIKAYEERAKLGMMANDSELRKLVNEMRTAIYTKVEGAGITMADIGITSSSNYLEGGRLVINETKLNEAIENNYENVVLLFTKQSDISATDMANRGQRKAETGVAQRLNDIMNDAVRTTRDDNNKKGYLIEKAGIQNDSSVRENAIQTKINSYDKRINSLLDRWYRQENTLYAMFTRMETAMMKMQSQQNNLAQLMAQSGAK